MATPLLNDGTGTGLSASQVAALQLKQTQAQNAPKIWGSPLVILIAGTGIAIWLGGTRFAPIIILALAGILAYWMLYPNP